MIALAAALAAASACYEAARPVAAGTVLVEADVRKAACVSAPKRELRFKRLDHVIVAGEPLQAGDYLGEIAPLPSRAVVRGAPLVVRSSAGPVVIERAVTAMQNGRSGQRIFVRDAAGAIFSVPLAVEVDR